jgi:hypothetical protein
MPTYVTSRRVALAATGGLLAALTLSGAAQAITDTVFRYSTPKNGYFTIHVMAMTPDSNASANDYLIDVGGTLSTGTANLCFVTGVNLPHGATMTRLAVWYTSNGSSIAVVNLVRETLANGTTNVITIPDTGDGSGTRTLSNTVIPNNALAKVNNAQYAYGFGICLGNGTVFHGARITYTYNTAGD